MTRARAASLVALLTLAAYANAPRASFQFDDWNVILRDPAARSFDAWWDRMPAIRPLLKLSYAACAELGLASPGFHVVNVGIHLAAALLVFLILDRLARIHGSDPVRATTTGLIGSLLFALHPVQTEAVTYACGRSVSLASLFALASIAAWVEGREHARSLLAFVASPLLAAAAVATKEFTLVVLPALLLLIACDPRGVRRAREAVLVVLAHGPVVAAGLVSMLASPVYRRLLATSLAIRDVGTNLRTQSTAIFWLGEQLVRPDELLADPKRPVVTSWTPAVLAAMAAIAALLVLGFVLVRRRPAVAMGVLWFFLWLAPTNSVLPRLDVANDRQLYVALIGPAWLLARALAGAMAASAGVGGARERPSRGPTSAASAEYGGAVVGSIRFPGSRVTRGVIVVVCLVAAVGLGAATFARNRVYFTEIDFWEDVVAKAPHNGRGFNNLGYAYALACRRSDAEAALVQACRLDPSDYTAPINLSLLRDGSLPGLAEACGTSTSKDPAEGPSPGGE